MKFKKVSPFILIFDLIDRIKWNKSDARACVCQEISKKISMLLKNDKKSVAFLSDDVKQFTKSR